MPVSKNPLVNYLVYTALIGMIAAVGLLSYASVRSADIQETNLMAYSEKYGIVFNVDRTLYRTDDEGHFIEKIGVLDLGLSDAVGDIVFAGNTLLAVGEEVLVSDIEHLDLLRLSAFSGKLEPFGDALVREALRAAGEARDFWET